MLTNDREAAKYLPRDIDQPPPEIIRKAEEELGETPQRREEALAELRKLLKAEKDLNACLDDNFLLMFLRCRKFNVKDALKNVLNYYTFKLRYSRLLMDFTPSELMDVYKQKFAVSLPFRDNEGRTVFVTSFQQADLNLHDWYCYLAISLMQLEDEVRKETSQICGIININDFKGISWPLVARMSNPRHVYAVSQMLKCFPVRFQGNHTVNEPAVIRSLFNILASTLPDKMRKRIHFHGNDLKSLQKELGLPLSKLPIELGGSLVPPEPAEYEGQLQQAEEYFERMNSYGFTGKRAESLTRSIFSTTNLTSLLPTF